MHYLRGEMFQMEWIKILTFIELLFGDIIFCNNAFTRMYTPISEHSYRMVKVNPVF